MEARSPGPDHPCYTGHGARVTALATGYAVILAAYNAEATEEVFSIQVVVRLRAGTVVVPPGQLSEWVSDDLEDETSDVCG